MSPEKVIPLGPTLAELAVFVLVAMLNSEADELTCVVALDIKIDI